MRDREEDRKRWNDPDFNKWLDEAISDAGHTVWDSIPDLGSAWNGWDAAKAALGYYCPSCSGSGEEIHTTYHGPDSFERLGNCMTCDGDGRTSAALTVAAERLQKEVDRHAEYAYASRQATSCACCGERKHTPLRVDQMGGYVCLTCIDGKLSELFAAQGDARL